METVIAVVLAILIVLGVFIAALCLALAKKRKRNGSKSTRSSTLSTSAYSNQLPNNLPISTTRIVPSSRESGSRPDSIGVFHIHVNSNSRSHPTSRHYQEKPYPEEPPPSYDMAIKMSSPIQFNAASNV